VEVQLSEAGGVRLLELVEQGALHLAISAVIGAGRLQCRPLFPIRVLAVVARRWAWKRRRTIGVTDLGAGPLLLLRPDFGSRRLFDAACAAARVRPRIALESGDPHSLVALAEAGQGVALVPSTLRITSRRVQVLPVVHERESLGAWAGVVWDPRRALPPYATTFMEELSVHARRAVPGRPFDRSAPPVPARPARHASDPPS
jgi:DNA-binding transcriptional LysR family regulator